MKKPVLIIVAMFLALSALCQNAKFGIFYDSDGEQKQILPKHLIVISQKAVSSNISNDSQTITYGIQGSQSDNIVPADASFLIYLLPKKSDKNNKDNWWFLTAKDGEDFAIVSTPEYNSKKDAVVLVVKTAEGLINIKTKFPKNDVIKATFTPKGD